MDIEQDEPQGSLGMDTPGQILRRAREAKNFDLATVCTRTRVPVRHLEAIEKNDLSALPGPTYAVGFARAYARAVGVDETQIAQDMRAELERAGAAAPPRQEVYEPADPARVPPRWLAWTAIAAVVLVAGGYGIWRTQIMTPPTDAEVAAKPVLPKPQSGRPAAVPAPTGPVVIKATGPVWLRIYEEDGNRLFEKEMAVGESFTVPANARNPMILTGRPQAIEISVGGRVIPPLGDADRTISDVPVSAPALLGRSATPAPGAPAVVPTNAPTAAARRPGVQRPSTSGAPNAVSTEAPSAPSAAPDGATAQPD